MSAAMAGDAKGEDIQADSKDTGEQSVPLREHLVLIYVV